MAVLSFFETGPGGELNPKLPPQTREAYGELLAMEGKGSAKVVASFLELLNTGKIKVTNFGLGVDCHGYTYLKEGVQLIGGELVSPADQQSLVSCHLCVRPQDLPLPVRVNLFASVETDPRVSRCDVDATQELLGLHPSQVSHCSLGS